MCKSYCFYHRRWGRGWRTIAPRMYSRDRLESSVILCIQQLILSYTHCVKHGGLRVKDRGEGGCSCNGEEITRDPAIYIYVFMCKWVTGRTGEGWRDTRYQIGWIIEDVLLANCGIGWWCAGWSIVRVSMCALQTTNIAMAIRRAPGCLPVAH